MKKTKIISILVVAVLLIALCVSGALSVFAQSGEAPAESKGVINVWLIGGQSNAVGYGNEVPAEAADDYRYYNGFENTLYWGVHEKPEYNPDEFVALTLGRGQTNVRNGAELGIAKALDSTGEMNAVIKCAWGATALLPSLTSTISTKVGTWTSPSYIERANMSHDDERYQELGTYTPWGSETAVDIPDVDTSVTISNNEFGYAGKTNAGHMYDLFVETVAEGVEKLIAMGYTPVLRGMWWMQGEAESNNATWSGLYDEALECLITDIRAEMNTVFGGTQGDGMPFVCGNIYRPETKNEDGSYVYTQQAYLAQINDAQAIVAEKLDRVYVVENGDDDEGLKVGEAVVPKEGYIDQPFFAQQDSWHFNSATQQYFGEKFVELALGATGEHTVTVDGYGASFTGGGIYKTGDEVTVTVEAEENFKVTALMMSVGGAEATEVSLENGSYTFTMGDASVAFTVKVEYTGDPLTTEYGEIPADYMDNNIYPFVLFEEGASSGKGYTSFGAALCAIPSASTKNYTILMRNNYTTTARDKAGAANLDMLTNVTVDLNGYSLTRGTDSYIFDTYNEGKTDYDTTVNVKNGNIVTVSNKPIIGLNYAASSAGKSDTAYNFNFDNVKFLNKSAILTMGMVSDCWENGKDTEGTGVNINIVFDNCTFDMGNIADPTIMSFTGGVTNTVVKATFNGGSIITANSTFTLAETDKKDTVVMGTYDGSYTKLILPEGTDAPATLYNNADGVVLSYSASEGTVSGNKVIYDLVLQPLYIEGYGVISESYKNSTFAIFNKQGFVIGADTWGEAVNAAKTESAKQTGDRWVAIYLRDNYKTVSGTDANTNYFRYITGTIVVDLGGNTLTRDGATLFDIYSVGSAAGLTRYEIKNGTLATTKSQIMAFDVDSSVNESVGKKTIEMEITGVTYKATGAINQPLAFTVWNNKNTSVGMDLYINYNDCTFDLTNGNGKHLFYALDTRDDGERSGLVNVHFEMNGGSILNMGTSWFARLDSNDTGLINASENGYPTVTMATGTKPYDGGGSANGNISTFSSSNGDKLQLTTCETGEVFDTYSFKISEKTPYGYIPFSEYGTEADKPFVVFQKTGENSYTYKAAYVNWIEAVLAGKDRANGSTYLEAVVFVRRDYESQDADGKTASGKNSNQIFDYVQGHLIIDLNGYTVARVKKNIFDISFRSGSASYASSITVKNGTLKSSGAHLIGVGIASNSDVKVFNFTFENVTFAAPATGAGTAGLVYNIWTNTNSYTGGTINMTFNDCTFDMTGLKADKNAIFKINDIEQGSKATITANNVINGGRIINYNKDIPIATLDANDTLVFANATGSYTKAEASAYPAHSIIYPGKDGAELTFVETAEAGVFVLAPSIVTKYGNIPARYENYPFVAFDENKNFIGADDTFLDTVSSYDNEGIVHVAKGYLAANTWDGASFGANPRSAFILVRADYKMASNESYNNLAQVQGVLLVDLNGHTLTAPTARVMFPATVKPWTAAGDSPIYPTEFEVINGTIEIVNSPLISFTPWNANSEVDVKDKAFNFLFENVEFDVIGTASSIFTKFGIENKTPDATAYPNLTFNNCTIDVSGAVNNAVIFDLGNGLTHASVFVNGGEIIAGNNAFTLYSKNKNTETDILFGKENGAYTVITVPSGVILPVIKVNGGELAFSRVKDDGNVSTYTLMSASVSDLNFKPKSSITLGSELVYNVYVPANAALKSFTVNGDTYENLEIVSLEDGEYYLVRIALPASEAAKNIVLKASVTLGGKDYNGTWTMSIPKYASKVISDGSEAEAQLVRDVLAYIRAAYAYFGTNDAAAIAKINTLIGENYYNAHISEGSATAETVGLKSATFVLDGTPSMRFYLADGADASKYEFFIGGTRVKTETSADGKYIDIDVYAYALCETVTYTIDGVESGSFHINAYYTYVSGDSYTGADKAELVTLTECFWRYLQSAREYRNSIIGG